MASPTESTPEKNLLSGLFRYRPRDGLLPGENFVTAALDYLLSTDFHALETAVGLLTQGRIKSIKHAKVESQSRFADDGGEELCIPDIVIRGTSRSRQRFVIWLENKWGSPLNVEQIERYAANLAAEGEKGSGYIQLCFMGLDRGDVGRANRLSGARSWPSEVHMNAINWSDLHQVLSRCEGEFTSQFVDFLQAHGLGSILRITEQMALSYAKALAGRRMAGGRGRFGRSLELRQAARAQCEAALAIMQAEGRKGLDNAQVFDGWGRVAIYTPEWKPSVGLLYDPQDHRTAFLDPDRPLDVAVRVQMEPRGQNEQTAADHRASLAPLQRALETLGYDFDQRGVGWSRNAHTALLGQLESGYAWNLSSGSDQVAWLADVFGQTWDILNRRSSVEYIARLPKYVN